jgi:hypothetical protein
VLDDLRSRLVRGLGSSWTLGVLAALAGWQVALMHPFVGLDASWEAALYMAAERGLRSGTQIVFTYGPLGFLNQAWLWYPGLAVVSWLFTAALYIALATSLVWALRRTLWPAAALLAAVLVLLAAPYVNVPIALTAVWCLALLAPEQPPLAASLVVYGGAVLGATETLVVLRTGPVILVMCAVALAAGERRRRRLPIFAGVAALTLLVLWFVSGQGSANTADFVRSAAQIVSGYSDAMAVPAAAGWILPGSVAIAVALVAAAVLSSAPGRARIAAGVLIGVGSFALYKEAVVRADGAHATILFATAAAIGAGLSFGRRRALAVAVVAALAVLAAVTVPDNTPLDFNPITRARTAVNQVRVVLSPARRRQAAFVGVLGLANVYRLSPAALALVRGHTVQVDPWEAALAWAYGLNWDPVPVFQGYSAYTSALDRQNADALSAPSGPQRILRENTAVVDINHGLPSVDSRVPAWDPPATALATLCHYAQLQADARWQVLGRVGSRCGVPRHVASIVTQYGRTIVIPPGPAGGVLYARVLGAGVSGLERVRATLYRAKLRYVTINGAAVYRLVPGTAADGLILDIAPHLDYPAPFALSPAVRTLEFTGAWGALRLGLYWMPVAGGGG